MGVWDGDNSKPENVGGSAQLVDNAAADVDNASMGGSKEWELEGGVYNTFIPLALPGQDPMTKKMDVPPTLEEED